MPKIGLSSYSLARAVGSGEMTFCDSIRWAAENGAEHIEIVPIAFDLTKDTQLLHEIIRTAEECGITISNYSIGANFTSEDNAALRAEIERVKREVDVAAALGARFMRHDVASFGGSYENNHIQRFFKLLPQLAAGAAEVAEYAKQYSITTSVENHGWFMNGSERLITMVETVARDNFRLTMDIGNFICVDETPEIAVRRCLPYASVVHFKDFYMRRQPVEQLNLGADCWFPSQFGTALCGAVVGWGDLQIPQIARQIREGGFDGFISLEFEGAEDCRLGAKAGLAILKQLFA